MPKWENSTRRDRLPPDWPKRRLRILRRDKYLCQERLDDGLLCMGKATDVDHIKPGDDHSDDNLQSLCVLHHRRKSGREGAAANNAKRREIAARFKRVEEHPGLL